MQMLRRVCRPFRCRSVRDYFIVGVMSTVLMCYVSFMFSSTWKEVIPHTKWQPNALLSKALKRSILAQKQQQQTQEKWSPSARISEAYNFSAHLHKMLSEIEDRLLKSSEAVERAVRVKGQPRVLVRDLPLYKKVLEENGFNIVSPPPRHMEKYNFSSGYLSRRSFLGPMEYTDETTPATDNETDLEDINWRLMLCLAFSDALCLKKNAMHGLRDYQKVSRFPGMRNVLWKRDSFCTTMTMAKELPAMLAEQVSPLCFVLPSQLRQLVHFAQQSPGHNTKWSVKPISPGPGVRQTRDGGTRIVDLSTEDGAIQLQKIGSQRMLAQELQENPLLVFGQPVSVRVYVLVTSIAPLRAFVHSEGVVYHRYGPQRNFKKIPGRTWLLSELWQYISKNSGSQSLKAAITNLYHVLLQMLLIVEAAMLSSSSSSSSSSSNNNNNKEIDICRQCFQLLGVDLIFNSTFHPVVLEVNSQPTLKESSKSESTKLNDMKKSLVDDLLNLLFPKAPKEGKVSHEVAEGLLQSSADVGILDWSCSIASNVCLSYHDLQYLVRTRLETLDQGGFRQLYPSADAGRHDSLVEQLQKQFTEPIASNLWLQNQRHTTSDLHRLLVNLERWYSRTLSEEYYNDIDTHDILSSWKGSNISSFSFKPDLLSGEITASKQNQQCSDDPSTMPFLASITTEPPLTLSPSFSPFVMEYYADVNYDVTLIRVYATAQNCQTEARMDDRFGPSRGTNSSLGVGENRLTLMVVDIVHAEPWIINSYTLIVRRLEVTHDEKPFEVSIPHQICSLKQECDLHTFSSEPCGLYNDHNLRNVNWTILEENRKLLPVCDTGDAKGRWLLPCDSCADRKSCFWKEATWHPYSCRYTTLSQSALRKCFYKKKLLFIGDSTNRGMMHYLIERLNGTLSRWDKTHDIRVYGDVNGGNTSVSFSYYPQFWLPTNQRPVFDKALYQLIQRSRPLENNSNTILIVGGVHWLATQHLHMLLRAIRVERLHGIKLVMKTLGAGFHQAVDSVHTLSIDEQQKLIYHSRGLADFAKHYNFEIIDTFNITIARYKDFLQGKCACHFHRVVENSSSEEGAAGQKSGYHVEGAINAIYSEIMLSRLCPGYEEVT